MDSSALLLAATLSLAAGDTEPRPQPQKSAAVAHLLSAGGLLVPVAAGALLAAHSGGSSQGGTGGSLIYAGLLLGPSAGYFYGGCTKRAWTGIGIRAGITLAALAVMAVTPSRGDFDSDILIGAAAGGLIAVEGIYECFAVGSCVRNKSRLGMTIGPGRDRGSFQIACRAAF